MSVAHPSTTMIATEVTEAGEQHLVPGVAPVTLSERLAMLAAQPMAPKRNPTATQKPCDVGLFDEAILDQTDLLDWLSPGG